MKTQSGLVCFFLCFVSTALIAQSDPGQALPGRAQARSFVTKELGRHYRRVLVVEGATSGFGSVSVEGQGYTVLGNGMGLRDEQGNWLEARPVVQDLGNFIVCTGAAYRVVLNANLNTFGAVDLETSDGKRLVSHPLAIAFYDPESGQRQVLAQVKDCRAELVSSNSVVYRDAFEGGGIVASVTYGYKSGRFHQDVTFVRGPSVSPTDFGLGSRTRLEVLTEFIEGPTPVQTTRVLRRELDSGQRQRMVEPDLVDEKLDFGEMKMLLGRGFSSESSKRNGAPVAKRLLNLEGRTILVEALEWNAVRPKLPATPKRASISPKPSLRRAGKNELPKRSQAGRKLQTFEARLAQAVQAGRPKPSLAAIDHTPSGFVMDYELVETADDVTFETGQTYLIQGEVTLGGVTTFESGAVLKYDTGASLVLGDVVCATNGSKTILTASDDASVGEPIGGYTGAVTNNYATEALRFEFVGSDFTVQNLDVRHATTGMAIISGPDSPTIYNCRFGRCSLAVSETDTSVSVNTVQMCDVSTRYETNGATGGITPGIRAPRSTPMAPPA